MKKRILTVALIAVGMIASTQADTVTFDFDTDLNASGTTTATIGTLSATHGSNSDANTARQMSQGWYSRDAAGDGVFFSSARSFDNKAGTDNANAATSLDMAAGAPSYTSFTMDAGAGNVLDFTGSTLSLDGMVYADAGIQFWLDLQVWANTGSGWVAIGTHQELTTSGTGTAASTMYADSAKTTTINGWALTGSTLDAPGPFSFDLSTLGAANQTLELAVAMSGTRDNHGNWGTSMDDLAVNNFDVSAIPEPATLGMFAAMGGGIFFIRRRFMI